MLVEQGRSTQLEWAVAGRPYPGFERSGDAHVVVEDESSVLLAVVDGLGHGPEAAMAGALAVAGVRRRHGLAFEALFAAVHADLRATRGAAMTVARVHGDGRVQWAGVGNVEGRIRRYGPGTSGSLVLAGGIVGYRYRTLRSAFDQIDPGDVVTLSTDGIRQGFLAGLDLQVPLAETATGALADWSRDTDDALLLLLRRT